MSMQIIHSICSPIKAKLFSLKVIITLFTVKTKPILAVRKLD